MSDASPRVPVVEADDAVELRSGSQGLAIRFARALNRVFGRRGKDMGGA